MKRAVIFDFGGVLMKTIDHRPRHTWDERLGLPHGSVEHIVHGSESWHKTQAGILSPDAYWADVARQLRLTGGEVRQLADDFYRGDALDGALIGYIRHLRARGHTVGLLSNAGADMEAQLRQLNIHNLFDPLIISAQIGVTKPDRAAFEYLLTALQRPAEAVIFVDDMAANVEAAAKLGIHAVHYVAGMDLAATLAPLLIVRH